MEYINFTILKLGINKGVRFWGFKNAHRSLVSEK